MVYLAVAVAAVILDQLSKALVMRSLELYQFVEVVPGFFNLVYVTNTGAAFSLLADIDHPLIHVFFVAIGIIAIVGFSIASRHLAREHRLYPVALGLIAGGAAGNLIDRLRFGAVVDFLDVYYGSYHWPAFNVADASICTGAGLFLFINLFVGKRDQQ